MKRKITLLVLATVLMTGCVKGGKPQDSATEDLAGNSKTAMPAPPAEQAVGQFYISALNEPCYTLLQTTHAANDADAICLRAGVWITVPAVRAYSFVQP